MEEHRIKVAEHALGTAKEVLVQLQGIRARVTKDVETLRADATLKDDFKRDQERVMLNAAQNEAAKVLQADQIRDRLTAALTAADGYTPAALARRGRFTVGGNEQVEQTERLIAGVTLPREPLGELSALCRDALATKRLGLAAAIAREAAFRASVAGAGEAEKQVARELGDAVRAVEPAELQGATKVFDDIRAVRRLIDDTFSAIGKPTPRSPAPAAGDGDVRERLMAARREAAA